MNVINTKTPHLVTFGEEFEKYDEFRILAMALSMHETDLVDSREYYLDSCKITLGEERLLAGYTMDEDLYPLIDACYALRVEYGYGIWVGAALLDYLRCVKGLGDITVMRVVAGTMCEGLVGHAMELARKAA